MNEVKPLRCAIYTRKSVEDSHHKEQNSLESQRILCEQYAQRRGWEIIPTLYEDYGRTGANMNRDGLQRLFNDIRDGKIDCVLVYKIDRLSRSLLDFIAVTDVFFQKYHVAFASTVESFDTTDLAGRSMMKILAVYAQYAREEASLRAKAKIYTSKKAGIWTGGTLPFGYKTVDRKLVPDEKTAPFLQSIFADYVHGKTLNEIAKYLNANAATMGVAPTFTRQRLLSFIRRPLYKGYYTVEEKLYPAQHEGLVSEEIWQQANAKVSATEPPRKVRARSKRHPFADAALARFANVLGMQAVA